MFALVNADIETIAQGRIAGGAILVDQGKIAAVGKDIDIPKKADTIDCAGRVITPGLIEAHSHAGTVEEGFMNDSDTNENTDPVTPHMMAIDGFKPSDIGLLEAAAAGITTMYLTQGSANVIGGIGAVVKTWGVSFYDQVVNPAAGMKMALGENPKRNYGAKGQMPATRMGVAALLRKTFTEAQNYIERKRVYEANDARRKDDAALPDPFAIDLKFEAIARLLAGEFPARCHAHRAIDMLTFMRIAKEFGIRYVFEHATEAYDILDELAEVKPFLVIGPSQVTRKKLETIRRTFANAARATAAGLSVAITSDHEVTPMRFLTVYAALAVREGMPEADALKAITLTPAQILGVDDRVGSIERGKEADLVVWPGHPLDVRHKPETVYFAGREFVCDLDYKPFYGGGG